MDDFEEIMKAVSDEGVAAARPVIKILTKMWKNARDELKETAARANRLRVVSVAAAVLSALWLCGCVYLGSVVHRQQGEIDALHRILDEGAVVEESTVTEAVGGDTAAINNGTFEQYNDNFAKNLGDFRMAKATQTVSTTDKKTTTTKKTVYGGSSKTKVCPYCGHPL